MYAINSFNGADLPDKTLCLTFDDGPGEQTYDIGKFLFNEGIKATFFAVGKYAYNHPEILQSLKEFNHIIGNHTYEHPDMPYYRAINGDIQNQIIRTDLLITKYTNGDTIYFRSPYGKWSAEVASDLNANLLSVLNHVGPIHWDIGGMDCYYWQTNRSVDDAVSEYYREISEKKKGIVLFHDDIADMDYVKPQNKTLALLKILIPQLKAEGYNFVSLDYIASIKKAAEKETTFYLKFNNKYLSLTKNDGLSIIYSSTKDRLAQFRIHLLSYGKIAIQSSNNLYLCVEEKFDNKIFANKKSIEETCLFDLIQINGNKICLRATSGNYLVVDIKLGLVANEKYMRKAKVFSHFLINSRSQTPISFYNMFSLYKKRLLYIKSKILEA